MITVDPGIVRSIFGCLIQKPELLGETDKYNLSYKDFHKREDAELFMAIEGLYKQGIEKINPVDIQNHLSTNEVAMVRFQQMNRLEYINDAISLSDVDNFPVYYNKLKKLNLVRDLEKKGFDTTKIYQDDLTADNSIEINSRFEDLTCQDIINLYKSDLAEEEAKYNITGEVETVFLGDKIGEFYDSLGLEEERGLSIQGQYLDYLLGGAIKSTLTIRSAASGIGKALPNSTIIPTPNGFKRVDEIKINDYLFDAFGKPTKVLGVYPQGKKKVFEVKFKDGRTAKCCNEHLWSYCKSTQRKEWRDKRKFYTKTLQEIIDTEKIKGNQKDYRLLVPNCYAVEYDEKQYSIPPYIMGLFLGDGCFRQQPRNKQLIFSSENEELPLVIANTMNYTLKKCCEKNFSWSFENPNTTTRHKNIWVEEFLVDYPELINTYSHNKFIPQDYLFGSIQQRFDLLNGLLDTDGGVDLKGRVNYTTNSIQLRDDVVNLARSLGFTTHIIEDNHKTTSTCWIVHIKGRPEDKVKLFHLQRKHQRILDWYNNEKRKETNEFNPIVEINELDYEEEMTCFMVDNEEHLFLMNDYIVTHNTRNAIGDACNLAFPFYHDGIGWVSTGNCEKVCVIITEQQIKEVRRMVLAWVSGINEEVIKYKMANIDQEVIIRQAISIIETYKNNFVVVKMPNPTLELIKTKVRELCGRDKCEYLFFDYIFICPSILREFGKHSLRNDKQLCRIYNFSVSSTGFHHKSRRSIDELLLNYEEANGQAS